MSEEKKKNKTPKKWYNWLWITRNFAWLLVALRDCFLDVKSFFAFRKQMKELAKDNMSHFVKDHNLKVNWLGNIVYTHRIMDINRVLYFDERMKRNYLVDVTHPAHEYLFTDLGWNRYLLTDFVEFSDEAGNPSGYYGVEFRFTPIVLHNSRVYKFFIFYLSLIGLILWLNRHLIATGAIAFWHLLID